MVRFGSFTSPAGTVADSMPRKANMVSGAVAEIESRIEALVAESLDALATAPITEPARAALQELGTFVAWRDR